MRAHFWPVAVVLVLYAFAAVAAPVVVNITEAAQPERICLTRDRCKSGFCQFVAEMAADPDAGTGLPVLRWRETWRVPTAAAAALLGAVEVVNDGDRPSVLPQPRPVVSP